MTHKKSFTCLALAASFLLIACSNSSSTDTSDPAKDNSNVQDDNSTLGPNAQTLNEEGLMGPLGGSGLDGEYAQFNDSPFALISFGSGYFYLEDFEDNIFEHPGASASAGDFVSISFGDNFTDSVDEDDGLIDGNSLDGESWFFAVSTEGITWTFDAAELNGNLPTHVGIVWTDGRNDTIFEAFDASGQSLGTIIANHENGSFNGETSDDRFYGVVNYSGISAIKISNDYRLTGIEVDHLQWGYLPEERR